MSNILTDSEMKLSPSDRVRLLNELFGGSPEAFRCLSAWMSLPGDLRSEVAAMISVINQAMSGQDKSIGTQSQSETA